MHLPFWTKSVFQEKKSNNILKIRIYNEELNIKYYVFFFSKLSKQININIVGWDKIDNSQANFDSGVQTVKQNLIMLFYTTRNIGVYFLIPCNIICIIGEVLFG
ncbi:hypothetical protein ABPG72_005245 [Tetrahymena utriculariae]